MLRRGPGLVRTVGRTAVIAGTASAVAGGVHHHQEEKYASKDAAQAAEQAPPPPPPPPQYAEPAPAAAPAEDSIVDQLKELAALHTAGVLSDAEFEAGKAKLLA